MPNENISEEWLNGKATITRRDFGTIVAEEIVGVLETSAAMLPSFMTDFLKDLLAEFGANVATRVFVEHKVEEDK